MSLGEYTEEDLSLASASELSTTPKNSLEDEIYGVVTRLGGEKNILCDSVDEENLVNDEENDETDVVNIDISFRQRQEEAKTTRRKKKKTNSSLVATTFKELYQLTGNNVFGFPHPTARKGRGNRSVKFANTLPP